MLNNQELINLMVSQPSWEDVIVKIIAEEQMDPWSIDIIKLADVFVEYVNKIEHLDLRVPARFILITAILLRMKSDIIAATKKRILIPEGEKPENEILRVLASVPPLQPPLKRVPLRNVTLKELITALGKAFEVKERRKRRKIRVREAVERILPEHEEDITERIEKLLSDINTVLKDIEDKVEFSRLVKHWSREEIIKVLIPLLHLSQDEKITYKQKELFKEIFVELKKHESREN